MICFLEKIARDKTSRAADATGVIIQVKSFFFSFFFFLRDYRSHEMRNYLLRN